MITSVSDGLTHINPSGAEAETFRDNLINTMPADATTMASQLGHKLPSLTRCNL